MSDLLSIGSAGLLAYRTALNVVGENVSNADTAGYSSRTVTLSESNVGSGSGYQYLSGTVFGGSNASSVQRVYDDYKTSYARMSASDAANADTKSQWLQTAETALDDGDTGLGVKLTSVFTSVNQLATDVSSAPNRQAVMSALQNVTEQFNNTANALQSAATGIVTSTQSTVDALNGQLKALSSVNLSLAQSQSGSTGQALLMDQRDSLLQQIATGVGVNVQLQGNGAATVTLAGSSGTVLVDATKPGSAYIGMVQATDGRLALIASSASGTSQSTISPQSGTLAGLVSVASTIASNRTDLDAVAQKFSDTINTWNSGGVDGNGDPGAALISNGSSAANIGLATTDISKIAAASTDGVSNGNALALTNQRVSGGSEAAWALLVSTNAQSVSSANAESSTADSQRDTALTDLSTTTGVNLDAAAAQLLQYQQAYSASSKIIQVARDTLQDVLSFFN